MLAEYKKWSLEIYLHYKHLTMAELTNKGKTLLEKLKQVVNQADINSKQAIQTANHGVEQTIEVLHSRKKKLEDAFKERNKLLEQSVKSCRLDEEIKEVCMF